MSDSQRRGVEMISAVVVTTSVGKQCIQFFCAAEKTLLSGSVEKLGHFVCR